jgi:hypothetical protein
MGGVVPAAPLRPAGLEPPPLHLGRRLGLLALGLGAWAAFRLLSAFPGAAEVLVGSGPLPLLSWALSRTTGAVPFSLAELVILGVLAAVDLEPWGGAVLPHEATMRAPVEDRLLLMRATGADLSPIYAVVAGPSVMAAGPLPL